MPKSSKPVMNQLTILTEMRCILREAAQPVRPGDSVKAQITRAARRLALPPRRAETLWYERPCRVLAEEADRLRAWRADWQEKRRARLQAELARLDAAETQLALQLEEEDART